MKDFLISLLPKTKIFSNPRQNLDLDSSIDIIDLGFSTSVKKDLKKIKESFLLQKIDKDFFPLFETEYNLNEFPDYRNLNDTEKENLIKAKIFISRNGIKTEEDYKFLASIFGINDIKILTYGMFRGNNKLDYKIENYIFDDFNNANFLIIVLLPLEFKQVAGTGKLDDKFDYQFVSPVNTLSTFQIVMREIIPITHAIKYEYVL